MGNIQNKTYTAPDGSVYRVENDGSITKIKGGKVQSNEPPSKYQITPDGQIYRVESDGSVTYLGNAEEKHNLQFDKAKTSDAQNEKSHTWIWGIVILVVGIICACVISSLGNSSYTEQSIENSYIEESGDNQIQSSADVPETIIETTNDETSYDTTCEPTENSSFNPSIENQEVVVTFNSDPFYWDDNYKEFIEDDGLLWKEGTKLTLTGYKYFSSSGVTLLQTTSVDNEHNSYWYIKEECVSSINE